MAESLHSNPIHPTAITTAFDGLIHINHHRTPHIDFTSHSNHNLPTLTKTSTYFLSLLILASLTILPSTPPSLETPLANSFHTSVTLKYTTTICTCIRSDINQDHSHTFPHQPMFCTYAHTLPVHTCTRTGDTYTCG